jgi:hypothetical protein
LFPDLILIGAPEKVEGSGVLTPSTEEERKKVGEIKKEYAYGLFSTLLNKIVLEVKYSKIYTYSGRRVIVAEHRLSASSSPNIEIYTYGRTDGLLHPFKKSGEGINGIVNGIDDAVEDRVIEIFGSDGCKQRFT